jgi:hypothetical protein
VLSTGAIVAIAIAGTVIILGILVLLFFIRRSAQKKADAKLQEANVLRNTIEQQRMSQAPSGNGNTASWVSSQKVPEPSVTEFPSTAHCGGNHSNHGGALFNDDLATVDGTVDGTVAGTVDHHASPRF